MMKKTIIAVILNLALFNLSFALKVPDTLEEAGELGKKTVEVTQTKLPGALKNKFLFLNSPNSEIKNVWQEDVIPVWQKMYYWFEENIWLKVENWFVTKFKPKAKEEIKKRKAIIGEDFKKEKEEFKKEAPQLGKNLQVFISEFFKFRNK